MLRWTIRRRRWPPRIFYALFAVFLAQVNSAESSNANQLDGAELVDGERLALLQRATEPSNDFATGKLNQFKGFYTPRPLPQNSQFTYSSVWASWSAWSFCIGHEQIRVRACNTVRGFSCLGPNRELRPCGFDSNEPLTQSTPLEKPNLLTVRASNNDKTRDYDVVDPWADDRREALRQLNGEIPLKSQKGKEIEIARQRSAGRTFQHVSKNTYQEGVGPQAPPIRSKQKQMNQDPAKAPSMTPELLFGSKIEIAEQPINTNTTSENRSLTNMRNDNVSFITFTAESNTNLPPVHNISLKNSDDEPTATVLRPLTPADTVSGEDEAVLQLIGDDRKQGLDTLNSINLKSTTLPSDEQLSTKNLNDSAQRIPNKNIITSSNVDKNILHSGEVVFPNDNRITLETARAFEWMLANMSRAAEAEIILRNKVKQIDGALHSSEAILPMQKTINSAKYNPIFSHLSDEIRRKEPEKTLAARGWSPPNNKLIELIETPTDSVNIRHSEPNKDVLNDASAEKLERDLLKIQSVMHQIKGELDALKFAENIMKNSKSRNNINIKQHENGQDEFMKSVPENLDQLVHLNIQSENIATKSQPIGIDLVPTLEPTTTIVEQEIVTTTPSKIILVQSYNDFNEAKWSNWQPWAKCFCSRQVRTRVCKYVNAYSSNGCPGQSYEARHCSSSNDNCPAYRKVSSPSKIRNSDETKTTPEFYTFAPPRSDKRHDGNAVLRPRSLAIASLQGV